MRPDLSTFQAIPWIKNGKKIARVIAEAQFPNKVIAHPRSIARKQLIELQVCCRPNYVPKKQERAFF